MLIDLREGERKRGGEGDRERETKRERNIDSCLSYSPGWGTTPVT